MPTGRPARLRIGLDLGGTKIEGLLMGPDDSELARRRVLAPRDDYAATLRVLCDLVGALEAGAAGMATVGVGTPGSLSPSTGLLQNANSTWLNGRPFDVDLAAALGRPVRVVNDANCFALSEAADGAGAGAGTVLGVILGTGCGGAIVVRGAIIDGPRGTGGEWGHNPLPWPTDEEALNATSCWCGRKSCMETWVSGPALAADHRRSTGLSLTAEEVAQLAGQGDPAARATMERHASRLARGLATVTNIVDPDVIVLGGGLSRLAHIYDTLPRLMKPFIFADDPQVVIRPPRWGDASGTRGAARLWDTDPSVTSAGKPRPK